METWLTTSTRGGRELWALGLIFAVVILGFLFSSFLADIQARGISYAANLIVQEGIPAIDHLAQARGDLRNVSNLAVSVERPDKTLTEAEASQLKASWRDFTAEVMAFQRLPPLPPESPREDLNKAFGALSNSAANLIDRVGKPEGTNLRSLAHDLVQQTVDFDDLLRLRIVKLASAVAMLGSEVEQRRVASRRTAKILNGFISLCSIAGIVFLFRMIQRLNREMASRIEELDAFAARTAHDLRNPLATTALALDTLSRERSLAPEATTRLAVARRSLRRATQLIDSLLLLARHGGPGESDGEPREVDAALTAGEVLEELEQAAKQAHVVLKNEVTAPLFVACDPGALLSILLNLVGNAIKYMDESLVRSVSVRAVNLGDTVRFEIADTGPGIPSHQAEHIFESFFRLGSRGVSGLGLGLATAKRLVEMYGGRIGVRSVLNEGSLFWFELPAARNS